MQLYEQSYGVFLMTPVFAAFGALLVVLSYAPGKTPSGPAFWFGFLFVGAAVGSFLFAPYETDVVIDKSRGDVRITRNSILKRYRSSSVGIDRSVMVRMRFTGGDTGANYALYLQLDNNTQRQLDIPSSNIDSPAYRQDQEVGEFPRPRREAHRRYG